MRSCLDPETRRARPLLGTFVEITAAATPRQFDRGFLAIEKVHRLMSFYDCSSDVGRINRAVPGADIRIHAWTWQVLRFALTMSRETNGAFDVVRGRITDGSWRDIILDEPNIVRCRRPAALDLGGIAKGFAVDRAVEALRSAGVRSGLVNAGGDMRAFGRVVRQIHLRHPSNPVLPCGTISLQNRAIATSGSYFAPGAMRDGRTGRPISRASSVTVAAGECMVADALTKVVALMGSDAAPVLKAYGADAVLVEADGNPGWGFQADAA